MVEVHNFGPRKGGKEKNLPGGSNPHYCLTGKIKSIPNQDYCDVGANWKEQSVAKMGDSRTNECPMPAYPTGLERMKIQSVYHAWIERDVGHQSSPRTCP